MNEKHKAHSPRCSKPQEGDSLALADAITVGDLVFWARAADGRLLLRRLDPTKADTFPREIFRVEFAAAGEGMRLKLFRGPKS